MSGKKHVFLFERYSGILQLDQANPEKSSIQLDIEARSAVVKDDWVSAKDARKIADYAQMEMMNSAKFPLLKFVSTTIAARGNGVYDALGNLTIRDITTPVLVMVTEKSGVCERRATVKLSD